VWEAGALGDLLPSDMVLSQGLCMAMQNTSGGAARPNHIYNRHRAAFKCHVSLHRLLGRWRYCAPSGTAGDNAMQIHFYIQLIAQNRRLAAISRDDNEIRLNSLTYARRETIQVSPVYH